MLLLALEPFGTGQADAWHLHLSLVCLMVKTGVVQGRVLKSQMSGNTLSCHKG
jgi:hypothetical protein